LEKIEIHTTIIDFLGQALAYNNPDFGFSYNADFYFCGLKTKGVTH